MNEDYDIRLVWDNEAKVWIATSEEIPGLVLEAETADTAIQKALKAAPELIELNGLQKKSAFQFSCLRRESAVFA